MIPTYKADPLYLPYAQFPAAEFKQLGAGPTGYGMTIPKMTTKVDARSLGYADPRVTIDMQIARREGEDNDAVRGPGEQRTKEGT